MDGWNSMASRSDDTWFLKLRVSFLIRQVGLSAAEALIRCPLTFLWCTLTPGTGTAFLFFRIQTPHSIPDIMPLGSDCGKLWGGWVCVQKSSLRGWDRTKRGGEQKVESFLWWIQSGVDLSRATRTWGGCECLTGQGVCGVNRVGLFEKFTCSLSELTPPKGAVGLRGTAWQGSPGRALEDPRTTTGSWVNPGCSAREAGPAAAPGRLPAGVINPGTAKSVDCSGPTLSTSVFVWTLSVHWNFL